MPERDYSWDGIREGLKRIATHNPDFLPNTVLVGGAACWYYRLALRKANDADFPVPDYTPDEESVWLSEAKDVKSAEIHFFDHDPALGRRLHAAALGLRQEHRAIAHWIRHHV